MFVMTGQGLSAMDCLSVYLAGIQASFGKEQTVNILKVPRYPACFFGTLAHGLQRLQWAAALLHICIWHIPRSLNCLNSDLAPHKHH